MPLGYLTSGSLVAKLLSSSTGHMCGDELPVEHRDDGGEGLASRSMQRRRVVFGEMLRHVHPRSYRVSEDAVVKDAESWSRPSPDENARVRDLRVLRRAAARSYPRVRFYEVCNVWEK